MADGWWYFIRYSGVKVLQQIINNILFCCLFIQFVVLLIKEKKTYIDDNFVVVNDRYTQGFLQVSLLEG